MATYGLDYRTGVARTGFLVATGWSPTLGPNTTGPVTAGLPTIQTNGVMSADDQLSKAFRKNGPTIEAFRQIVTRLLEGQTTVGNATHMQITGQTADQGMGGRRPITTTAILADRAYTAADKAALSAIIARTNKPTTYVTDVSKNGGGGKVAW